MVTNKTSPGSAGREEHRSPLIGEEWLGRLAALEGLADSHQGWTETLLREVRTLPRVIEDMAASARSEIDRQVAIEREAHQRALRHVQEDIAACDAELARVATRLDDARATIARLTTRLAAELELGSAAPATAPGAPLPAASAPLAANGSAAPAPARPEGTPGERAAAPGRHTIVLAVHGARRATLGLSIREHLQRFPYVEDVALSNYAENVLRLEIVSQRPISLDDALTWEQIPGVRIVSVRPDEIEAEMEDGAPPRTSVTYTRPSTASSTP
ncbi:MAG TPA: hypothetical protein VGR16_10025 [Thermomicrobiales bacterium]|nr:hypothetical protein [Thermomicrobiales bacterium]